MRVCVIYTIVAKATTAIMAAKQVEKIFSAHCGGDNTKEGGEDKCNCFLHSYTVTEEDGEIMEVPHNVEQLQHFVDYLDELTDDSDTLTFHKIKTHAKNFVDDQYPKLSFKFSNN